ncbi:MAG: response regulator [Rhodospirillales bacterium]|nr:response regulator [Alphaproteobacteria bacterium]MBL6947376.1 response regulator [Rhodospirillales bacterium]
MTKILVIEDDEEIRVLIQRLLEREGFEVEAAEDGVKGMEAFRTWAPDMVITDLVMPRMKGEETIREIRSIDAEAKIIAISGGGPSTPSKLLEGARNAGALETLAKPFDPVELLSAVHRLA